MKKSVKIIVVFSCIAIVCFSIFFILSRNNNSSLNKIEENKQDMKKMKEQEEEKKLQEKIENIINDMSIDEKIGQMMIISLQKNDQRKKAEKEDYLIEDLLENVKPGGVIISSDDFKNRSLSEMIELTTFIKDSSSIPMIISVDQEGGRVQRLISLKDKDENGITYIPTMKKIGEINDINIANDIGRLMGLELNTLGINMDLAPVIDTLYVDSNVIGDRSFGNDPELVKNMGVAVASGLKEQSIIPVFKHFPNHGSTSVDSHEWLPEVTKTKEELYESDLIPFQKVIEDKAEVIMVGHLLYPEITDYPSSLSKEIITDLLKDEMGFDGLVVTDSLRMKAIINKYGEKEVYEMAINAGVDILLMPYNPDYAINYIKESISEGKIAEEQIDNSVRKILRLKYTSLKNDYGDEEILQTSMYKELSDKISNIE